MHEIDLHGYRFVEGKEKIISEIKKCWKEKTGEIRIIHGYHGHTFKDYIESEEFLVDILNEGHLLTRKSTPKNQNNRGESVFTLENTSSDGYYNTLSPINKKDRLMKENSLLKTARIKKNQRKKLTLFEARALFLNGK
jgi:hypothetical protein